MKIFRLIFGLLFLYSLFYASQYFTVDYFKIIFVLTIGLIIAFLALINLEIGLYILIFVVPFTQQYKIMRLPLGNIDIGTDDVFIFFIIFSWLLNLAKTKRPAIVRSALNWPMLAFFTAAIFSYFGAAARFGADIAIVGLLHLIKFFEYVIIYFIVMSTINDIKQIKKFVLMCFIAVGLVVFSQLIAMAKLGHFNLSSLLPRSYSYVEDMYTFGSNAILGAYYCFFLSILLAIILYKPRFESRTPLVIFALFISFCLFNTFSRSSYLGLFISFTIFAIFKEKRIFLIILLMVIISPLFLESSVFERVITTVSTISPTITLDESATIRLVLWRRGLDLFFNNPIFGTGYWTTRYFLKSDVHSQFIAILIETGIVGFLSFCWLIFRMFRSSKLLIKKADDYFLKALGLGYMGGLGAVLGTCIFSETLEAFRFIGTFWFTTALVASAHRLLLEKKQEIVLDST